MAYLLPAIQISDELLLTWLSFLRYSPNLKNDWKIHSSLELFSAFGNEGHLKSVQRARLGVSNKSYAFGLALNLGEKGKSLEEVDVNPGVFVQKSF
ncbi:MAG: hypothetical protein IPL49_09200 [Saprospirales bacterium]|nr:hypothetical protein [Saprospirales bacterium]MBK8491049.1 hypothetical protein [Saprospirales bacterium]